MTEPRAPYEPGPGAPPSPEPRALSPEDTAYLRAEFERYRAARSGGGALGMMELSSRYFLPLIDALEAERRARREAEIGEFSRAAAFLRELQAHTRLTRSPGPLYSAGYGAGIEGAIKCLEDPASARRWLEERIAKAEQAATEEGNG